MDLSILLSRIQFGITIGFHILYPTLNIGLAVFISIMEGLWLKTRNPIYLNICKFWIKIFALTFGMGVVSGIVMAYELGTNFGHLIAAAGSVLGPLFGYEVLSAFFLEAGFLGIMLFGWNRVGPKLHYAATLLVTIGTLISAFWIMSANSWMQTPTGYSLVNGKFSVLSWWDVIFNPSFFHRFTHMLMASLVTSSFVIAGICAWYLLKQRHFNLAKPSFSLVLMAVVVLTPLQILIGDMVGITVHEHQPLKTAAMEGNWDTQAGAPLILFAIPDIKQEKNLFAISIPKGASLINTHSLNGVLLGLKSVPSTDRPVILPVFFGFRVMVAIGFLLFAMALWGLYLRWRHRLYDNKTFLRACVVVSPLGFVATICGWVTAESGRQPWVIYNLIRTTDAASTVPAGQVATSLTLLSVIYLFILFFYIYYLFKIIKKGPKDLDAAPTTAAYLAYSQSSNKRIK